mgnify:CR=1 FL=1
MLKGIKKVFGIGLKKEISEYTVIGANTTISGEIVGGKIYVEGKYFASNSTIYDVVQIAKSGEFDCEGKTVSCNLFECDGEFVGTVDAAEVILHKNAYVRGVINTRTIVIEEGAVLDVSIDTVSK